MLANRWIVDLVEDAFDRHPNCSLCRRGFDVVEEGGGLWLICRSIDRSPSLLRRLIQALTGHDRILVTMLPLVPQGSNAG